jgi:Peptidase family S41
LGWLVVLAVLLGACGAPGRTTPATSAPAAGDPGSANAAAAGWLADLRLLAGQMEALHPDLFHGLGEAEWRRRVAALERSLPSLRGDQVTVEVMRLVAGISVRGRDGHMGAFPVDETAPPVLPLRFYLFADGLHVVDAMDPYARLVGGRVTRVGGQPVGEVVRRVSALAPKDSQATVPLWLPRFLVMPEVYSGLGITPPGGQVSLTVQEGGERPRTVRVGTVSQADYLDWIGGHHGFFLPPARPGVRWLSRVGEPFWFARIPGRRALYVQYNQVAGPTQDEVDAVLAAARGVDRMVVDLRHNLGGDNTRYGAFVDALRTSPLNRPGRLYLLVGRATFSAAANFATTMDRRTRATFAGEPTGGGVNQYGETREVRLERLPIPLLVPVPTEYVEAGGPGDRRLTITPELPVRLRAADYFAGRDPVLAAVLARPVTPGN